MNAFGRYGILNAITIVLIFETGFKKEDVTVKGCIKITLISLCCLLLFIVAPLMITGYYISKSVSDSLDVFDDFFDTGYTHEEIKEYVQDEHGLEVEIIENEGKDPNMKGLGYHDAVVE